MSITSSLNILSHWYDWYLESKLCQLLFYLMKSHNWIFEPPSHKLSIYTLKFFLLTKIYLYFHCLKTTGIESTLPERVSKKKWNMHSVNVHRACFTMKNSIGKYNQTRSGK